MPPDLHDQHIAEYLRLRQSAEDPIVLAQVIHERGLDQNVGQYALVLVRETWWEKARQDRIVRVLSWGTMPQYESVRRMSKLALFLPRRVEQSERSMYYSRWARHANRLKVALRLYQARHGKPAQALADLVPAFLPQVPTDPWQGLPVRYRLSQGEEVDWPGEPNKRVIRAGQGILASVGEKGKEVMVVVPVERKP